MHVQVWRNCLYYSGKKDDATSMAREVAEVFDSLFADRVLAPILQRSPHTPFTPQVCMSVRVCAQVCMSVRVCALLQQKLNDWPCSCMYTTTARPRQQMDRITVFWKFK